MKPFKEILIQSLFFAVSRCVYQFKFPLFLYDNEFMYVIILYKEADFFFHGDKK